MSGAMYQLCRRNTGIRKEAVNRLEIGDRGDVHEKTAGKPGAHEESGKSAELYQV